jgi:hypothetical protein
LCLASLWAFVRFNGVDGIGGSGDQVHLQGPGVVEPGVGPTAEQHKAGFLLVPEEGGVFTAARLFTFDFNRLGFDLIDRRAVHVEDLIGEVRGGSGFAFRELTGGAAENEEFPAGDSLGEESGVVPAGNLERNIGVDPLFGFEVEGMDVRELAEVRPTTIDDQHLLGLEDHGGVSTTSLWGHAFLVLDLGPFGSGAVEEVEVVKGSTLVTDTSVTAENVHLLVKEVGGTVRAGLGGTDLGLRVLRLATGTLVGRLLPVEISGLQDVHVVKSQVGGVKPSKNEEFLVTDFAGSVVSALKRLVTTALDLAPFNGILDQLDSVDVVVREDLAILFLGRINTAEHDGHTVHAGHSVAGASIGNLAGGSQLDPFEGS